MTFVYLRKAHTLARLARSTLQSAGKRKVFCIGKNKTGTTSLAKALQELGLVVGKQSIGERLIFDWSRRDFRRILLYCYTAQAFQDIPFSLPFTFQAVDQKFPTSKFILTVRDTPEQWYNSLINYHAALFGHGHVPTLDDLKAAVYVHPGWVYKVDRLTKNTPAEDPYNKALLIAQYNDHNKTVMEYFRHRSQDLLVLNVAMPNAYEQLCNFLEKPYLGKSFPWENKTIDITEAPEAH